MSSVPLGHSTCEVTGLDWTCEETKIKWRGQLVEPLRKLLVTIHSQLTADDESLLYVEGLLVKLLAMMTVHPVPTSVTEVEKRVNQAFSTPIDAVDKANQVVKRGRKKSIQLLTFPVEKLHLLFKDVLHSSRVDEQVSLYIVAVLEHIAKHILQLAYKYVRKINRFAITSQDVKVALWADTVLVEAFDRDEISFCSGEETLSQQTYHEVVRDLITDEKQYLRELQTITKVFKDRLQGNHLAKPSEIERIFGNVEDLVDLTVTLIGSLDDTLEMTEDGNFPLVGSCFEELAEAQEFDNYDRYMQVVLSIECKSALESLLTRKDVCEKLNTSGKGFREAVKFFLPKLLLFPVHHCLNYFKYIETLRSKSTCREDKYSLDQAASMLSKLQTNITMALQQTAQGGNRRASILYNRSGFIRLSRQNWFQKLGQVQQAISSWEGADIIASNCSELIYEGKLCVFLETRRRLSDRYVFLLDGLIIICKMAKRGIGTGDGNLKLCSKFNMRLVDVIDRKDIDDLKYTFEIAPKDQPKIIFKAESSEDKNTWMASLIMLTTKPILERHLDSILIEDDKKHPLQFPPCDKYRFSEPNNEHNIICEETDKGNGIMLIKGATLVKLVERLTFHMYADPMFVKAFLITYRSFSNPNELLNLLIERFNIPDPVFNHEPESDSESQTRTEIQVALALKRFRKEYKQPVQFRVLNVLKHWVDEHFYDFDQDNELLEKLTRFLGTLAPINMKKWVDCIVKLIQRRQNNEALSRDITFDFDRSPPEHEIHIEHPETGWPEILSYHPIEYARQLTLLEFDYYRAVKPSELVDQAWMKKDKDKRSPNLLRMVRHTTMFTRCLEKLIVECENIEERVAVINRALEIMTVLLYEYNNFNGVIAITSVMNSSSVHRLVTRIKDRIPNHLLKNLEEASSLVPDHFKVYWEKLRSINPPCVPFFGQYQTNILFLEEGNPDFLQKTNLINFSKWRKVAEIISEIQQYQNQPYCLKPMAELKSHFENMDPFPGMTDQEITDYLWGKSNEVEPKTSETMQRKRPEGKVRWKGLNLRSPGIKPTNLRGKNHPNPLPRIRQPKQENGSPMTSPVFQVSPTSLPSTPVNTTSASSPSKTDPIMAMVNLAEISSKPPPQLPPRPARSLSSSHGRPFCSSRHNSSMGSSPPPLPPRNSSMAPPPRHTPKSSMEPRSPRPDVTLPRRQSSSSPPLLAPRPSTSLQGSSRCQPPSPLSLRSTTLDGTGASWLQTVSPGDWHGQVPSSTPISSSDHQHFVFNQNVNASSAISPSLPPRRPTPGSGQSRDHLFDQVSNHRAYNSVIGENF